MTTTARESAASPTRSGSRSTLFAAVAGLTAVVVLLQGLWAGLFVPTGKGGTYKDTWVEIHAHGADAAILLALVTTIIGFVRLRRRRDLWIGAAVLTVLLVLEAYVGGLISDESQRLAAAIHIPLALAIMAITVWLPLRARRVVDRP